MALWTTLWFCFYALALGQERQPTVRECCRDGRDKGLAGHDCTLLPLMSPDHTCMTAQEQCCVATLEARLCDAGVSVATQKGACERPFLQGDLLESQLSKMCCDCCMLGQTVAHQGLGCDLGGVFLGKLCEHTAKACCSQNNTTATKETTKPPVKDLKKELEKDKTNVTPQPKEDANRCKDSVCSQLCLGNGTCGCLDGYQLKEDGVTCEDVNECLTGNHNCIFGLFCINIEGSFRCQRETGCGTGYELTDNNRCQDINECVLGTHNCGPEFVCTNTAGSFRCHPKETCAPGYMQDAIGSCIDINECVVYTSPCPPSQTCINSLGSFTCRRNTVTCGRGYHLTEDGTRCEDVDECRTGGVCGGHGCINLIGSYRCECRVGYIFNSVTKLCDDINECRYYPGTLCPHKCENTEGSYKCSCPSGLKLASDGRNCEDVNECETHPCSQECANVYGSYQCYCRRGYQLSDIDGVTCEDIDECALPTGGHICSYRCANAPGSFYCTCPPEGYTLASNGRSCQDIDECATGSHTCSVSQSCFNVQGGFRCLSFACPMNFRQAAPGNDGSVRCIKSCPPSDFDCQRDPVHLVTYTVLSLPTFRDFTGPEEIVFLRTIAAANPASYPDSTNVVFDILSADDQFSFDVIQSTYQGMIMGVVRQVKPITGPKDIVVEVAMNYVKSGIVSHRNIVKIHLFISAFWF